MFKVCFPISELSAYFLSNVSSIDQGNDVSFEEPDGSPSPPPFTPLCMGTSIPLHAGMLVPVVLTGAA
jgi:hypothetical protein